MAPQKVKTTKKDPVAKEKNDNSVSPLHGLPWSTVAEFSLYEEASHKKEELLRDNIDGCAKIRRTSKDTFVVKFRSLQPPQKSKNKKRKSKKS